MKKSKSRKKLKKIILELAGICLAVLFFVLLAGFGRTAPENPMEEGKADASRMYLTSSTLAMDEKQLAGVENANISSGGTGNSAETQEEEQEEEQPEQTEEPLEEEQEEEQTEEPQQNSETNIQSSSPTRNSLTSLIQKHENTNSEQISQDPSGEGTGEEENGQGGGTPTGGNGEIPSDGGGETTLDSAASSLLFTTDLADDTVTEPDYSFHVSLTEAGQKLTLVSQNVILNGAARRCVLGENQITLQEGYNTVSVSMIFRDSKYNQITAKTKDYVIYYVPESHYLLLVQNARTGGYLTSGGETVVYENNIWIRVIAKKGNTDIGLVQVRINGTQKNPDSDGVYRLSLKNGSNTLKVTAGTGVNQQVFNCTVNYKRADFALTFESSVLTETITGYNFGGYSRCDYKSDSPAFSFRVSCSAPTGTEYISSVLVTKHSGSTDMKNMMDGGGWISLELDASQETAIQVSCVDSDGTVKKYTWYIRYIRNISQEENQKKAPLIQCQLGSETVHYSPYVLPVSAYSWDGNLLHAEKNFVVYLNGVKQEYDSISSPYYEYDLYLTEGENYVVIQAWDSNQYTSTLNLTITFTPEEQSAKIHFILSADVVGLGTMIDEYVTVPAGYTVAQVVEERLAAYAYTTIYSGTPSTSDYFLHHIQKAGILSGWSISDAEREWVEMEGFSIGDPVSLDSLGERDFTGGSGWMITLNDYFIGSSMGSRAIRDGDQIHILYTLDVGKDVGVDPDAGIYE